MKKPVLLVCLLFISTLISAQPVTGWYKTFTGKVGNMDAVLHLVSATDYQGYLWFMQNQSPLAMSGMLMNNDSIMLSSTYGVLSITLNGIFQKDAITGNATIDITTDNLPEKQAKFYLKADSAYTPFAEMYSNTTKKLPKQLTNQSEFSYFKGTVWPRNKTSWTPTVEKVILKLLQLNSSQNIGNQLKEYTKEAANQWITEINKMSPKEVAEMGFSLSQESQEIFSVMYEDSVSITLSYFTYLYSGGAHGNYSVNLSTVLKSNGQTLKLEDVLTKNGIDRLPDILKQIAKMQFKIKEGPLKENGFLVDQIPVSGEFYITGSGIGFLYNPYDIMPFSEGIVNLFVPFQAIRIYLKPPFSR